MRNVCIIVVERIKFDTALVCASLIKLLKINVYKLVLDKIFTAWIFERHILTKSDCNYPF
jgi:hypothetical protein